MAVPVTSVTRQTITVTDATVKTYVIDVDMPTYLNASLTVVVDGETLETTQYTIASGSITLGTDVTIIVGSVITLTRNTPITQLETFENTNYLEETEVEQAIDKLTYIAQEVCLKLQDR